MTGTFARSKISLAEKLTSGDLVTPHPWPIPSQIRYKNLDVQGEKPVRNDAGEFCLDGMAKQAAWKSTK